MSEKMALSRARENHSITLICQVCGKPFQVRKSYYEFQNRKNNEVKFCSRNCYRVYRGYNERVTYTCIICGKKTVVRKSKADKYTRFCSLKCRKIWGARERERRKELKRLKPKKISSGQFKKGHIPWSSGKKGLHLSPNSEFKKADPRTKVPWTEYRKQKISKKIKEYRNQSKVATLYSIRMKQNNPSKRPEVKQKLRLARLKQVFPVRDTSIEIALQGELDRRGVVYKKHLSVCDVCQPDIVFPNKQVAIFADGDYFHSKEFKNGLAWEKDRRQNKILSENGWVSLRFWEHEIKHDVVSCVDKIIEVLN